MTRRRDTIESRFRKRDLPSLLVRKFLTEYGYDHGPVVAEAIVADILATIERCCPERVPPKTVTWLAVCRQWRGRKKGVDISDLVPVQLPMVSEEEIRLLMAPALRREHKARRAFCRARFARWCFEAYEQGGVLTLLDLSMLSGLAQNHIGELLREYEAQSGRIVPTRGTVHDLGPGVTHKREVIRRWLRGESAAKIARVLNHSQEAVDRYLADFQKVRLLAQQFPAADLPVLAGLSASVVRQYLALLQEYEPNLSLWKEEPSEGEAAFPEPSDREPGAQGVSRAKSEAPLDTTEQLAMMERELEMQSVEGLPVGH
jgi:hypothetical protein